LTKQPRSKRPNRRHSASPANLNPAVLDDRADNCLAVSVQQPEDHTTQVPTHLEALTDNTRAHAKRLSKQTGVLISGMFRRKNPSRPSSDLARGKASITLAALDAAPATEVDVQVNRQISADTHDKVLDSETPEGNRPKPMETTSTVDGVPSVAHAATVPRQGNYNTGGPIADPPSYEFARRQSAPSSPTGAAFWSRPAVLFVLYAAIVPAILAANYAYQRIDATLRELHTATKKLAAVELEMNALKRAIPGQLPAPGTPVERQPEAMAAQLPLPTPVRALAPEPVRAAHAPASANPLKVNPATEPVTAEADSKDDIPDSGQFFYVTDDKKAAHSNFKLIGEK